MGEVHEHRWVILHTRELTHTRALHDTQFRLQILLASALVSSLILVSLSVFLDHLFELLFSCRDCFVFTDALAIVSGVVSKHLAFIFLGCEFFFAGGIFVFFTVYIFHFGRGCLIRCFLSSFSRARAHGLGCTAHEWLNNLSRDV